jgi:hypothetical protein
MKFHLKHGIFAQIDPEDFDKVKDIRWVAVNSPSNHLLYAQASIPIVGQPGRYTTTKMHRLLMDCPKGMVVDHINGDSLDNRKANLRIVTQPQNAKNRRRSSNNVTGVKGVAKNGPNFVARITSDGVTHQLGTYKTLKEAAEAYERASVEYHKEYRRKA